MFLIIFYFKIIHYYIHIISYARLDMDTHGNRCRINKYVTQVDKDWSYKWWNWIMQYRDLVIDKSSEDDSLKWFLLAQNPNASLDIIRDNLDEFVAKCSYWWLLNPNMTWDFIVELVNRKPGAFNDYAWSHISDLNFITLDIVSQNMQYPWDWDILSMNLPLDIIFNNPEYPWNYNDGVSSRLDLSLELVNKYKDKPWNWDLICQTQNCKTDTTFVMENHQIKPCCCTDGQICMFNSDCPNTLFSDIDNTNDKSQWSWWDISENHFSRERANFIVQKYRTYMAAYRIQLWWRRTKLKQLTNNMSEICRTK